jgi:hypothetical protein
MGAFPPHKLGVTGAHWSVALLASTCNSRLQWFFWRCATPGEEAASDTHEQTWLGHGMCGGGGGEHAIDGQLGHNINIFWTWPWF